MDNERDPNGLTPMRDTPQIEPEELVTEELMTEEELDALMAAHGSLAEETDMTLEASADPFEGLDPELRKALELDLAEDAKLMLLDEDRAAFVSDVSVYSEEGFTEPEIISVDEAAENRAKRAAEAAAAAKKAKRARRKSRPALAITVMGVPITMMHLSAAAALLVAAFFSAFFVSLNIDRTPEDLVVIGHDTVSGNDAQFTFVDQVRALGGSLIRIDRVLASPEATVFHLMHSFDTSGYNIKILDDRGDMYFKDLSGPPPGDTHELRLQPLNEGITRFALVISDPKTGRYVTFDYAFAAPLTHRPARVMAVPVTAESYAGLSFSAHDALFSAVGSNVGYRLTLNRPGSRLVVPEGLSPYLTLFEGSAVLPHRNQDDAFAALAQGMPNVIEGRIQFSPVRGLDSHLRLRADNLFEEVLLNETIPVSQLLNRTGTYQQSLPLDGHTLFLERILHSDGLYILVMHARENATGERVEVRVTATLTVANTVINSAVRSGPIGSDVLFDGREMGGHVTGASPGQAVLHIEAAQLRLPSVTLDLPLTYLDIGANADRKAIQNMIETSFESRLAYKSGQIGRAQISGFAPNVLADTSLMAFYTQQVQNPAPNASYSAQLTALSPRPDGGLNAIVRETWMASERHLANDFLLTHKITLENRQGTWVIVANEIVSQH